MKASRTGITVTEGLLPLLDVSILMLGLLFVLWNMALARQAAKSGQASTQVLPGINMVVVLDVAPNGNMTLRIPDAEGTQTVNSVKSVDELKKLLMQRAEKLPKEHADSSRRPLVLVVYQDPWRMSEDIGAELAKALRDSNCRYARVYP